MLLVAGMAAGCSAQVARFGGGVDDIFTASTPNQRQIINQEPQPFPTETVASAPVSTVPSSSVSRGALAPVSTSPVTVASAPVVAPVITQQPAIAAASAPESGAKIEVQPGDTLYGLSRRYGVPTERIMQANGMTDQNSLKAGRKIVIPGLSASETNTRIAAAKPAAPADQPPKETEAVAVLPTTPKPKEVAAAAQATAGANSKAASSSSGGYTVQPGDTLSAISRKTGVAVTALKQENGLSDGLIRIGQTLKIPGGGMAVASAAPAKPDPILTGAAGPSKPAKAEEVAGYTPPRKAEKVIEQAVDVAAAPDSTGIGRMRWPARGRVISAFGTGSGKGNDGIDIAVPEGTPVKAAENGVVIYAGDGLKEFGNTVLVRHEDGLVTVYGHASELKVARGETVRRGQEIAVSGMSGTTDRPKLHFEVRKNSAPVDPTSYLE